MDLMNAEQMFKELGYAKKNTGYSNIICYEKDASIRNLPHIIGTQFALNDEHVSMYSIFGKEAEFGAFNYLDVKLLNAINKQCKELGWLEEEKQKTREETNLEHYFDDLLKVGNRFTFMTGKIEKCDSVMCRKCVFNGDCGEKRFKWLASSYVKPSYKLNRFEFDLIQTYRDCYDECKLSDRRILRELKDKGHFKYVDESAKIHDILANCEVID